MMCISSRCDCEEHLWWVQGRVCAKYASKKIGSIFHLTISLATIATIGHTQLRSTANFELGFLTITFNLTGRGHFSRRKYLSHPSKEGRRVGGRRWRLLVCSYGDWGGQREKGEAGTRGESGAGYRVSLLLWNLSTQSLLTQDLLLNFKTKSNGSSLKDRIKICQWVYYPIKFDICLPGGAPPHLTLSPSPNVLSQILPNIHCTATGIIISLFKCKPLWNDTLPSAVLQRNLMQKCNPREFHLKRLQKCPISSTEVFLISVFLEYLSFLI